MTTPTPRDPRAHVTQATPTAAARAEHARIETTARELRIDSAAPRGAPEETKTPNPKKRKLAETTLGDARLYTATRSSKRRQTCDAASLIATLEEQRQLRKESARASKEP